MTRPISPGGITRLTWPSVYLLGTQCLLAGSHCELLSPGCLCPLLLGLEPKFLYPRLEVTQLACHACH